jgi:subtilisin family serine protease
MRRLSSRFLPLLATLLALPGCSDRSMPAEPDHGQPLTASVTPAEHRGRHIVVFTAERIPADFAERVEQLGGTVSQSLDSIGVGVVHGLSESAVATLAADADVRAVEPDIAFQLAGEDALDAESVDSPPLTALVDATASPTAASLYPRQWNMRAIGADKAWDGGLFGSPDVVVVILDTGIDYLHPELQGLVDPSRSRSFVPDEDSVVQRLYPGRHPVTDLFWHGTAMAATVASNAKLLAGVTQHVTLIAVKVADRFGVTTMSAGLAGILYAADQGADVMNVSGGVTFDKSESPGLIAAYLRALNYAWRKGVLVVGVAGNDTLDRDHDRDLVALPCEAPHAICASATGPTVAHTINGPWDDTDASAPYTSYGRSAVSVAAPGGQRFTNTRVWVPCLTTPSGTSPSACRVAPMCPKPSAGTCLNQGIGTSFSAAHTTGLAALLVQQLGHGNPALIRERILQSADDLGAPGTDPYYGRGRINIARALGLWQ